MAPEDLNDLPSLINEKPELAYSIAFITSFFVPGYARIRASLTPHVLKIVRTNYYSSRRNDEHMWTLLQALGVLYLYASPIDPEEYGGTSPYHPELSFRVLKPLVESLAVYASIHRSYEDVARVLHSPTLEAMLTLHCAGISFGCGFSHLLSSIL